MTITLWNAKKWDFSASVEQDKFSALYRGIVYDSKRHYVWYQYDYYTSLRSAVAAMRKQLRKATE